MFEQNLTYIGNNPKHWFAEFTEYQNLSYTGFQQNQHLFLLEPSNNIFSFTHTIEKKHDVSKYKKQLIMLFGIGAIDEIAYVLKEKHPLSHVFIIEPNPIFLSYVLEYEDLRLLNRTDVHIFCDTDKKNILPFFSRFLSSFELLAMVKNVAIYFNEYYRQHDLAIVKEFISEIKAVLSSKVRIIGNAVQDGILGLKHNVANLGNLMQSKDVRPLKDVYKNKPAIVVAAGPSLNKNIEYLKTINGRALIIAVDTITMRLVEEGIIPDFICSIERGIETYDYFYKNKVYPKEITLVGPLVLYPKIFEEYKGNYIIPFREGVGEYRWLETITGLSDNYMPLGLSCAHVAFGVAINLGCSPIILTGQDLAFSDDGEETHAAGTIYDDKEDKLLVKGAERAKRENEWVDGYYGGKVRTSKIWVLFKNVYEEYILKYQLRVINATEGGADIAHTDKMPLKEAIASYCTEHIPDFYTYIQTIDTYDVSLERVRHNMKAELNTIQVLKETALQLIYELNNLDINTLFIKNKTNKIAGIFERAEKFCLNIHGHMLLMHNLQGLLLNAEWHINGLGLDYNREKLQKIADIRVRQLWSVVAAITEVEDIIQEFLNKKINDGIENNVE